MPSTKKQGRIKIFAVLLALCLLFAGCVASSVPEPSEPLPSVPAEETETTSVPEETVPEETVPDETVPEGPAPDTSMPEGSTPEDEPDTPPLEAPVPPVDAPLEKPERIDSDDPEVLSLLDKLAALAEEYGLSVSYLSGDGGCAFSVNGGAVRQSASTIKAMYCEYLLESGVDLQAELRFDVEEPTDSASGQLTEEKLGSSFPLGDLIDYTLRYSDNMAYTLLYTAFGNEHYNEWVEALGVPGLKIKTENGYARVCADDLSLGMLEIYRYSQRDSRVVSPLKHARFRNRISAGTAYAVACKFGLKSDRTGYHETAIVYAPAPYVLTVMSALNPDNPGEAAPFTEVAKLTDQLNQRLFQYEP